ncbi:MAG: apolipoprotein N-acyltransferase, partial [Nitratireductor sp.]
MHDRLLKLSAWCVLTSGWTRYLSAFVAGLFSALAMAPFDAFPILFLTLPVFIWLLDGAYSDARSSFFGVNKTAFLTGWWFGFGYFVAGLWWIANALLVEANTFAWLIPLGVAGLPAGLAIFWGLAAITIRP